MLVHRWPGCRRGDHRRGDVLGHAERFDPRQDQVDALVDTERGSGGQLRPGVLDATGGVGLCGAVLALSVGDSLADAGYLAHRDESGRTILSVTPAIASSIASGEPERHGLHVRQEPARDSISGPLRLTGSANEKCASGHEQVLAGVVVAAAAGEARRVQVSMISKRSARATTVRTRACRRDRRRPTGVVHHDAPATITSAWVQPLPNFHRPDTR